MSITRRVIRAVKILARDGRIPRPLRGLVAFGLLPIPGPFDETVVLIVGLILWAFYRDRLREAWNQTGGGGSKTTAAPRALSSATQLERKRARVDDHEPPRRPRQRDIELS